MNDAKNYVENIENKKNSSTISLWKLLYTSLMQSFSVYLTCY